MTRGAILLRIAGAMVKDLVYAEAMEDGGLDASRTDVSRRKKQALWLSKPKRHGMSKVVNQEQVPRPIIFADVFHYAPVQLKLCWFCGVDR